MPGQRSSDAAPPRRPEVIPNRTEGRIDAENDPSIDRPAAAGVKQNHPGRAIPQGGRFTPE